MKTRLFFLTVLTAATLALTACSGSEAKPAAPTPAPHSQTAAEAYNKIQASTTSFSVGSQTIPRAYIFFDAQCSHCGHLWESAKPLADKVRLVWIPIGMLSRASTLQGATILGAADPVKAMSEHEKSLLGRSGGISTDSDAIAKFKDKVDANTAFFNSFRGKDDGVPLIVTKIDGEVRGAAGALPTAQLKEFLGIKD